MYGMLLCILGAVIMGMGMGPLPWSQFLIVWAGVIIWGIGFKMDT